MEWLLLPIRDVSTLGPDFKVKWPKVSEHLRSRLDAGESIVLHCRGGLGRAGMIAGVLGDSASMQRLRWRECEGPAWGDPNA